jgi:hypothetical protein
MFAENEGLGNGLRMVFGVKQKGIFRFFGGYRASEEAEQV